MNILSVNISSPRTVLFNGKKITTGIFKTPVQHPVFVGVQGVKDDHVADTINHGGKDKACYLYSFNHYDYWKKLYPDLEWDYGMLGENLTVEGLDESQLKIGDILNIGTASLQVAQPRLPCYKLGIKFGNQEVVNQFRAAPYPGAYMRVLKEGWVAKGDTMTLTQSREDAPSLSAVFQLAYSKNPDRELLKAAIKQPALALRMKIYLSKKFITALF